MNYFKTLWKAITAQPICCKVQCKVVSEKGEVVFKGELEKWFVNVDYNNFEPTLKVYTTTCSGIQGVKKVKISSGKE